MEDVVFAWVVGSSLLVSFPVAFMLSDRLQKKYPSLRSFWWGYFVGTSGLVSGTLSGMIYIANSISSFGRASETYTFIALMCLVFAAAHLLIVLRSRWGFLIAIILQLNPILWIINAVYLHNRWHEMAGRGAVETVNIHNRWDNMGGRGIAETDQPKSIFAIVGIGKAKLSFVGRAFVAASVFWFACVLSFIFLFEPYGSRMYDDDWWHAFMVMSFPPGMAFFAYLLWEKFVKSDGPLG